VRPTISLAKATEGAPSVGKQTPVGNTVSVSTCRDDIGSDPGLPNRAKSEINSKPFGDFWRATQNKTANSYVIEVVR